MVSKIKIAHIVTNFALGGAQDYLITTIQNLNQNKFDIFIFGHLEGERIEVLGKLINVKSANVSALSREISPVKDIIAIFQIFWLLKKYKIDLVHTHSSKAGVVGRIAAKLAGVGIIIHTIHGFSFHDFMTQGRRKAFILLERLMARITDALLLVSEKEKKIATELKIIPKKYLGTIYNGVDFLPFEKSVDLVSLRKTLDFDSKDFIVGFSGRFSQQKAIHILIESFSVINKEFPQTKLLLVGDGILRNDLELLAKKLNIFNKIRITGFKDNVASFYKIMDVFVMTSLWEGLSRSLAEAMYAKLPVIATDVGGTSDAVINHVTGWLVKPNNVMEVVDALREAITSPDIRMKMGENGFNFAKTTFNLEKNSRQISDLYIKLLQ